MAFTLEKDPGVPLKVKVYAVDGAVAQKGESATGKISTTIQGFKVDGTLDEACKVFDAIIDDWWGGSYDSTTAKKFVTRRVYNPAEKITQDDIQNIFSGDYQIQGNVFKEKDIRKIFSG